MKMKFFNYTGIFLLMICGVFVTSCRPNPNLNESGKDELKSLEVSNPPNEENLNYDDTIYVPIYSDIYINANNQTNLLSATLSIRNTSYTDSLYVTKIDYFNTDGELVRSYLTNTISLKPMATVNYVIEREDREGGSGANFIVELSSKNGNVKPVIQAIMIGEDNNKSFAFTVDGYSIGN